MVYIKRDKEERVEWDELSINEKEALLMYIAGKESGEIKQLTGVSWNMVERLARTVRGEVE